MIDTEEDYEGRILRVTLEVDSLKFQILTIYGQNPSDKTESNDFFDYIEQFVDPTLPVILAGDFNMVQDLSLDREGGNPRSLHTYGNDALEKFVEKHALCDLWRHLHPTEKRFTWATKTMDIQSRLDRIYFPIDWLSRVKSSHLTPFAWSDHDIEDASFSLPTPVKRGSGYWKFNTRLLNDPAFVSHVNEFFEDFRAHAHSFENEAVFWDCAKINFKKISIFHSTINARKRKSEREQLLNSLRTGTGFRTSMSRFVPWALLRLQRKSLRSMTNLKFGERSSKRFS